MCSKINKFLINFRFCTLSQEHLSFFIRHTKPGCNPTSDWHEKDELTFAGLLCTVKAFCPADTGLAKYWKRWVPDRLYCPPLMEDEQSLQRVPIKRSDQWASKQAKNSSTLILTVKLQTKSWKSGRGFVQIKDVHRYVILQFVYLLNIETWRIK